jgi:hypothetical protein
MAIPMLAIPRTVQPWQVTKTLKHLARAVSKGREVFSVCREPGGAAVADEWSIGSTTGTTSHGKTSTQE